MLRRWVRLVLGCLVLALLHNCCDGWRNCRGDAHHEWSALRGVLSLPYSELAETIQGTGKAKLVWSYLRKGIDPLSVSYCHVRDQNFALSDRSKELLMTLNQGPVLPHYVVSHIASECSTQKLLLRLRDGMEVETVVIPSSRHQRSTVCVSSQVGCDRACRFCLTGTMGLVRNLTSDEIIAQVVEGLRVAAEARLPPLRNVVFMGMGDAARNIEQVSQAVLCLTDRDRMAFGAAKVTVSTVGPSPDAFQRIAALPCSMAWSLHSPIDAVRRRLVASSQHSTVELRQGLIDALSSRSNAKRRTLMIAITLLEDVNDGVEDARALVKFVQPILHVCPKVAIDLIPYNDVKVAGLRAPSMQRVCRFQELVIAGGLFCAVRLPRGDRESAACGMLATATTKKAITTKRRQVAEGACVIGCNRPGTAPIPSLALDQH